MGLNFYHRVEGQEDRHIGTHKARWEFLFRAHRTPPRINSWASWKFQLLKEGRIFDEYEKEYTAPEFIALVEKTKGERNHVRFLGGADDSTWNDQDGWSISLTDFC